MSLRVPFLRRADLRLRIKRGRENVDVGFVKVANISRLVSSLLVCNPLPFLRKVEPWRVVGQVRFPTEVTPLQDLLYQACNARQDQIPTIQPSRLGV